MQKDILPEPKTKDAGGHRAIFWAVFALVILGASVWWLTRDYEQKEELRAQAADLINDKLKETPFAGIGDILRDTPPPLPTQILNPPTEKGTLSGRLIEGTVGSPMDLQRQNQTGGANSTPQLALDQNGAQQTTSGMAPQFSNEPLAPVTQDSRVTPDYLADFAQWLAARYQPGPRGGTLTFNVQNLNNLFGITMAQKTKGGRTSLLRYAFHPSMVQGLYHLYIDRFLEDLNEASRKQGLSAEQNHQFHLALAGRTLLMATALEGVLHTPDLAQRMSKIDDLGQKAVDINAQLSNAVFELDEMRSAKASQQQINAIQMRIDGITARFKRAEEERLAAQRELISAIHKNSGQSLDDESLLYIAAWAQRRLAEGGDAIAALNSCAAILRDLAKRCAEAQTIGR